jgi:CBS domain containing-hemolysin-like protein
MTAGLLLLAVALIAANGFFVGAEFAVLAARRARLEPLLDRSRRARSALRAIEHLPLMISGCQFGITLASLGLGALGEPAVAELLTGPFEAVHLPDELVHPVSIAVALTFVSVLHMLFGEMVPKNLALAGPERAALALAPPLMGFVRVFRPVIVGLTAAATGVVRLLRTEPVSEIGDASNRDAVAALIGESRQEGLLPESQHELLSGALEFEDRTARSVALPLTSLVTVTPDVTPAQVEELVASTGFSRFPVETAARGTASANRELVGYLHLADVLETDTERRSRPVDRRWIRPLAAVPATATLQAALGLLRRGGSHLARVVGEDGSDCGVIALEDILEQLVGEVTDATRRRPQG